MQRKETWSWRQDTMICSTHKKKKLEKLSFCATFSCKAYVGFINGAYCIRQVSITVIIKQLCYTGKVKKTFDSP